jgi:hypothetical protein
MTSRLALALLLLAPPVLALCPAAGQPAGTAADETIDLPFGKDAWDVRALNDDPVRLVKATSDRDEREVRLILEFRRDLTVRDTDWTVLQPQPPFWFRFQDRDGTTIASLAGTYGSLPVGRKGRNVRVVLKWPPFLDGTSSVIVDHKGYGE